MSVCETIHNIHVHMQRLGNSRSLSYEQKRRWGFTSPNCHKMIYTTQCCGVGGHRGLIISACGTVSPALTGHGHRLLPAIYQMHPLQVSKWMRKTNLNHIGRDKGASAKPQRISENPSLEGTPAAYCTAQDCLLLPSKHCIFFFFLRQTSGFSSPCGRGRLLSLPLPGCSDHLTRPYLPRWEN